MAYVHKMLTQDEKMVGVARLHWIYVLKGIAWFLLLAAGGWIAYSFIMQGLNFVASGINTNSLTFALSPLLDFIILIPMAIGFSIFVFNVIKVLSTEIGLTDRRIIKKTGLVFVKTNNIDIEEIRGENTDAGWFGRFLNYAYVDLDCRFIGDVRIDAIEQPNLFMRHLHKQRAEAQDTIRMITGKSSTQNMVEFVPAMNGNPNPEIAPPQPEISPPNPPAEVPTQPEPPKIDPPSPTQPPTRDDGLPPLKPPSPYPSKEDQRAQEGQKAEQAQSQPQQSASLDPQTVAQVVQQVMPQMAQEVVKQMAERGLIPSNDDQAENNIDMNLIHSFDEVRTKRGGTGHDLHNQLEHAIH